MDKVSAGTEQLLLEALYQVHGRWHAPDSDDTDDVEDLEEPGTHVRYGDAVFPGELSRCCRTNKTVA